MIYILIISIGVVGFSLTAGNIFYSKIFKRSGFEKKSMINNEIHVKDSKIMVPIEEAKNRWAKKRNERKIKTITITRFSKFKTKRNKAKTVAAELWEPNYTPTMAVILVHGFSDTSKGMAYLAEEYNKQNFLVLSINLRAHGKSYGEYPGLGFLDAKDVLLWISYLNTNYNGKLKIILHGISMGASAVLQAQFSKELWYENGCHILGTIADSSYACLKEQSLIQISKVFGNSFMQKLFNALIYIGCSFICFLHAGFLIGKSSPVKAISNLNIKISDLKKPFLIIFHGEKDTLVYPENADRIYRATQKANISNNTLIKIKNAPHIGGYFYDQKKYMTYIMEAIKKNRD